MQKIIIDSSENKYQDFLKRLDYRIFKIYQKEQFIYRMYICSKCIEKEKCDFCNCDITDTISDVVSCNNESRFPHLMNDKNWQLFKKENNIKIL